MLEKKSVMNMDVKLNIKFHKLDIETPLTIMQLANFGVCRIPISFNINEDNKIIVEKTLPCIANVVIGDSISNEEIIDIFQPTEDETMLVGNHNWMMPQLLKALGVFESVSQASKNGWNKTIPFGFSEHIVKHSKVKGIICIWKGIEQ